MPFVVLQPGQILQLDGWHYRLYAWTETGEAATVRYKSYRWEDGK